MLPSILPISRWSAYRQRNAVFSSSTHKDSTSSMYWVPANQRLMRPICPSAARVPISEVSSALTVGLVGASGANRLIHRLPRHSSFRLTAATTASDHALGDSLLSKMALALDRISGSCTSKEFNAGSTRTTRSPFWYLPHFTPFCSFVQ